MVLSSGGKNILTRIFSSPKKGVRLVHQKWDFAPLVLKGSS